MPRWTDPDNNGDDEDEEQAWDEDDGEDETIPCPHCRREIHEDTPRCPYCGNYVSREDVAPARKPWWVILGVAACLYVVYRWIFWI